MDVTDLIGPMLGAAHLYLEGEVIVEGVDGGQRLRFWSRDSGASLRVQRGDGLLQIHTAEGSVTRWGGRVLDSGPRMRLDGDTVASLILPRYAYLWGRPGEDWRLTEHAEQRGHVCRIALAHTSGQDIGEAWVDVDPDSGRIVAWRQPWSTTTLSSLSEEPQTEPKNAYALASAP